MIGQCGDLTVKLQQLEVLMFEYLLRKRINFLVCYMLQTTNNKNWYKQFKKSTEQYTEKLYIIRVQNTNNLTNIKTIMYTYLIEGTTV